MSPVPCYVAGLLLFGCLNTLTTKIQWTMYSMGSDGTERKFEKPWFSVLLMFLAMAVVGIVQGGKTYWARYSKRGYLHEQLVPDASPGTVQTTNCVQQQKGDSQFRIFLFVGVPAILDLVATGVGFIGFLYIPSSTYQMLRGSMIVFSAVESVLLLGRRLCAFHWVGITTCVVGIAMVGLSNSLSSRAAHQETDNKESPALVVFGVSMVLLAQFFQATQVIVEEQMLKGMNVAPMLLVGYEGVWGSLAMLACVLPALNLVPGQDHGAQENLGDTLAMLRNSSNLRALIVLYLFSCSTYNISGMQVTGALSAVHRTMLEASRTLVIWMIDLLVHYAIDARIAFGEVWTIYSWLQLAGFVVLISGQAIYGGILKVPGLYYDLAAAPENPASPAAMQVMSPGLPPPPPKSAEVVLDGGELL